MVHGGAVGGPVEQQGVADTAWRGRGDDPLILHLDAFGASAPQRVQDGLDVLLMHDQVVRGRVSGEAAVGVALGVGQRDDETGAADRVQAGVGGQDSVAVLNCRQGGVGARRTAVVGVDLGDEGVALCGEPVHRLLGFADEVDQPGCVAAPDLVAARDAVSGRQKQSGQQANQGHAEAPGGGPTRKLGTGGLCHRLPPVASRPAADLR